MYYLLLAFLTNFSSNPSYKVEFDKIDNLANIYVNDSLVYSSGTIDFNPELGAEYIIELNWFLKNGENKVEIELLNGHKPYKDENDPHWEIKYAFFKGDEEIDYVWESQDDNKIGTVFKRSYYVEYEN